MREDMKYKPAGKEKHPTNLHQAEIAALQIVIEMAYGNMHCRRTDEKMSALKLVENMLK